MKNFSFILAVDSAGGLGKNGTLARHIPADMRFFKQLTTKTTNPDKQNAVIMGKNTRNSIPERFRPLPSRKNIVLSTTIKSLDGAEVFTSFDSALASLSQNDAIENIYIIGGAQLYSELLGHDHLENIYLTQIQKDYDCDVYFDGVPSLFNEASEIASFEDNDISVKISKFSNK